MLLHGYYQHKQAEKGTFKPALKCLAIFMSFLLSHFDLLLAERVSTLTKRYICFLYTHKDRNKPSDIIHWLKPHTNPVTVVWFPLLTAVSIYFSYGKASDVNKKKIVIYLRPVL